MRSSTHWTLDNYRYFFSVSAYVSTMWCDTLGRGDRDGVRDRSRVPVRVLAVPLRAEAVCARCFSCS